MNIDAKKDDIEMVDTNAETSSAANEVLTFEHVSEIIGANESRYIRARNLLDGVDNTAMKVAFELRDQLVRSLNEDQFGAFLDWAVLHCANINRVVLDVSALLALDEQNWNAAHILASEVVARDHHDLLAQRIIDAAGERSQSLELEVDQWLKTRTCKAPFSQIETRTNGTVHICCSAWQPVSIGNLNKGTEDFWNSERANEIRRSVQEGDFSHCSRWHCPSIATRRLPGNDIKPKAGKGPERVILSHDRSCNISCPSCRTKLLNLSHAGSTRLNTLFEERLLPIVKDASLIKVTGSGDPFGSRHFRYVLGRLTDVEQPQKRIQLHTNGLLANERAWNDLKLRGNVTSVWVSIDAATPETYAKLRRGGNFEILVKNLEFLGQLKQENEIDKFRLDFVVQHSNYLEMRDFVDLARNVGADGVYFLRLRNWGHVPTQEFRNDDVCSSDHPEHSKLLKHLADPRFDLPGTELGSMANLVATAKKQFAKT